MFTNLTGLVSSVIPTGWLPTCMRFRRIRRCHPLVWRALLQVRDVSTRVGLIFLSTCIVLLNPRSLLDSLHREPSINVWYSDLVGLDKSLLIPAVRRRELGKKYIDKIDTSASISELRTEFEDVLQTIQKQASWSLQEGDSQITSASGLLRFDVSGGGANPWQCDIQDHTGMDIKHQGKSLSSVFARMMIPNTYKAVPGPLLAAGLHKSHSVQDTLEFDEYKASVSSAAAGSSSSSAAAPAKLSRKEQKNLEWIEKQRKIENEMKF